MSRVLLLVGLVCLPLLAVGFVVMGTPQTREAINPAAAVLKSHIMSTPEEMKWGDCPPVLPPGARCAVIEGDTKAPNVLFAYRLKLGTGWQTQPCQ